MRSMRKMLEAGVMTVAAIGFFGFVYPELCLIEDTCQAAEEQEGTVDSSDQDMDILQLLSSLPPEKIRIKSRLLEYLYEKKDEKNF